MLVLFVLESMAFQLNYPPETGIKPEQTLQMLGKDKLLLIIYYYYY